MSVAIIFVYLPITQNLAQKGQKEGISSISTIIKAHEINLSQFSILCLCNFCDEEWLRAIEYGARRVSDPMRPVRMPSRVKIAPVPSLYSLHTRIAHLLENREICVQH